MPRKQWPSVEDAKRFVSYNPETGELKHLPRKISDFEGKRPAHIMHKAWSARCEGKKWGRPMKSGHISGNVRNIGVYAHQVAWAIMTGEWPDGAVSHKNGDPSDNRWCNLQLASQREVCRNQSLHRDNKSGQSGVLRRKDTGKWVARIGREGSEDYQYLGGAFDTFAEAALARQVAEAELRYHENHGKRPSRSSQQSTPPRT